MSWRCDAQTHQSTGGSTESRNTDSTDTDSTNGGSTDSTSNTGVGTDSTGSTKGTESTGSTESRNTDSTDSTDSTNNNAGVSENNQVGDATDADLGGCQRFDTALLNLMMPHSSVQDCKRKVHEGGYECSRSNGEQWLCNAAASQDRITQVFDMCLLPSGEGVCTSFKMLHELSPQDKYTPALISHCGSNEMGASTTASSTATTSATSTVTSTGTGTARSSLTTTATTSATTTATTSATSSATSSATTSATTSAFEGDPKLRMLSASLGDGGQATFFFATEFRSPPSREADTQWSKRIGAEAKTHFGHDDGAVHGVTYNFVQFIPHCSNSGGVGGGSNRSPVYASTLQKDPTSRYKLVQVDIQEYSHCKVADLSVESIDEGNEVIFVAMYSYNGKSVNFHARWFGSFDSAHAHNKFGNYANTKVRLGSEASIRSEDDYLANNGCDYFVAVTMVASSRCMATNLADSTELQYAKIAAHAFLEHIAGVVSESVHRRPSWDPLTQKPIYPPSPHGGTGQVYDVCFMSGDPTMNRAISSGMGLGAGSGAEDYECSGGCDGYDSVHTCIACTNADEGVHLGRQLSTARTRIRPSWPNGKSNHPGCVWSSTHAKCVDPMDGVGLLTMHQRDALGPAVIGSNECSVLRYKKPCEDAVGCAHGFLGCQRGQDYLNYCADDTSHCRGLQSLPCRRTYQCRLISGEGVAVEANNNYKYRCVHQNHPLTADEDKHAHPCGIDCSGCTAPGAASTTGEHFHLVASAEWCAGARRTKSPTRLGDVQTVTDVLAKEECEYKGGMNGCIDAGCEWWTNSLKCRVSDTAKRGGRAAAKKAAVYNDDSEEDDDDDDFDDMLEDVNDDDSEDDFVPSPVKKVPAKKKAPAKSKAKAAKKAMPAKKKKAIVESEDDEEDDIFEFEEPAPKAKPKAKAKAKAKAPAKKKAAPAKKKKAVSDSEDDAFDSDVENAAPVPAAAAPAARPSRRTAATKVTYTFDSDSEVDLEDEPSESEDFGEEDDGSDFDPDW